MALAFKIILVDMQFSRVWIRWRKDKKKTTAEKKKEIKRGPQNKAAQSIFIVVQDFYF